VKRTDPDVTHPGFEAQLDAYLDGELAPVDARELEAHIAQCQECARFRDGRLELRAAITARVPAFQAPDAVRERVRAGVRAAARGRALRRITVRGVWSSVAIAASVAVVALGSWRLGVEHAARETLMDGVVGSHVRSLMPGHLTDVLSSDQHTVKPWFNGRLDFSPPVSDFAGVGYPLLGGRLDYVDGRAVAGLVYGRRKHVINVFLWPAARGPAVASATETRLGYHVVHWTTSDYTYWAVSDLGMAELHDFVRLVQQGDSATAYRSP
jgi:anti-sigma factor RsiW